MNIEQHMRFFELAAVRFRQELDNLSELDSALGDGDHGASMLKGFSMIWEKISQQTYQDIGTLWMDAGKILMKEVGGTCGPLFATILIKGGFSARGAQDTDAGRLAEMLHAGSEGVQTLGKASPGDKTMVDALAPAARAMDEAAGAGAGLEDALCCAVRAARDGAAATKDMLASRGRGRYQAENAIGHVDPGAVSVCILLESLYEASKTA